MYRKIKGWYACNLCNLVALLTGNVGSAYVTFDLFRLFISSSRGNWTFTVLVFSSGTLYLLH